MVNVYKYSEITGEQRKKLMKRAEVDIAAYESVAREIIADVREKGDAAIAKYTEKFDGAVVANLKVTADEIDAAYRRIDEETRETLHYAAKNIGEFHKKQMPEDMWFTNIDKGLMVGEKTTPIVDVCLYVPRGKGSFPSVLLMLAIPAVVAGVPKIVVVTPPNEGGDVDDAILAAAKIVGVTEIYKVGGVQAVASVAFGTETIPKCHKIIGPGNAYVTAAKRVLTNEIDSGTPAGPSEAIILCDEHVNVKNALLDWLIEAEHGPDSASLLVTHSQEVADAVLAGLPEQLAELSEKRRGFIETNLSCYGGIVLTDSLEQSVQFVNDYAPEHMEVMVENPFDVLPKINNAGEILLGGYTPVTLCNFLLGPNAILPTGGFAKTYSSVSVFDFLKRSSIGYATKEGFLNVRSKAGHFAHIEGFETHERAVIKREV